MTTCPLCSAGVVEGSSTCPSCGAALTGTQATIRQPPPKEKSKTPTSSRSTSTSSRGEGNFLAGTVLNDRYRITGLLGRGGMGEVTFSCLALVDNSTLEEAAWGSDALSKREIAHCTQIIYFAPVSLRHRIKDRNLCPSSSILKEDTHG